MTNTLHSYKSKGDMYAHSLGYLFEEKDWLNIKQALILYTNTVIDLEEKLAEQAERVTESNGSEVSLETEAQEPIMRKTTRDEKIVRPGVYEVPVEQTPQNPVGVYCGEVQGIGHRVRLDVELPTGTKLYAAPVRTKDYNPEVTFNDDGTFSLTLPDDDELRIIPPQQEPTAEVSKEGYAWGKEGILPAGTKLYTRPVRTKDLTDDEIVAVTGYRKSGATWPVVEEVARAVIAAYKEKNK